MQFQTTLYNAFSGMTAPEKSAVVRFLQAHTENANKKSIEEAVEYALKNKPSFGGFVLTAQVNRQIIATIVANQTGMAAYSPGHLFVYVTVDQRYLKKEQLLQDFFHKAIDYANGDIAMHVKPDNPALQLFHKLGFSAEYLELRLHKKVSATA
jgi:ribosomal-protein-alanine N-acetyltransferase